MKILQVCPLYYPSIGGVQLYVKNISERLAREHKVTVFTTDAGGNLPRVEEINGVLVRRFQTLFQAQAYHFSPGMWREMGKLTPDVVHGHNYHSFPLLLSRRAKRKRFVVSPSYHGHGATGLGHILLRMYRPLGARILEEADRILAISRFEKALLLRDFNLDEGKVTVVPGGVERQELNGPAKKKGDSRTILYAGRLEKYKGVQHILRAMTFLDDNIHLEIVGDGGYKKRLQGMCYELGIDARVSFSPSLSGEELNGRYSRAGILMLLSRYESFGITVAEALAAKTPCIVANTSALSEWVDNRNCFGIDNPGQSRDLARMINQVMGREVCGVQLSTWDDVAARLEQIYCE